MSEFELPEKICLVVPCYNEENRLELDKFKDFDKNCYFLFVNDGSKDNTIGLLKDNQWENMFILDLEKNGGKAEAVRQGMLHVKNLPIYDELTWVAFWDADLATPLDELFRFMIYSKYFCPEADSIWGSRIQRLGSNINRTSKRQFLGNLFASVTGFLLKLECYDSQCGAKLFKKEIVEIAFSESFISKWIFDVEILLRLSNYKITEYPLNIWIDVEGSKVKISREAHRVLKDIFKIRKRYKSKK